MMFMPKHLAFARGCWQRIFRLGIVVQVADPLSTPEVHLRAASGFREF